MNTNINANRATLLISCPERPGIISTVSNFLLEHKANIVHFDQHTTDPLAGIFFMRIEFDMNHFDESFSKLKEDLPEMAREYSMEWKLSGKGERKRMAIFVSKMDHCLLELLDGKVDFIVLARYMQILSPSFISKYPNRIINIHHSFLPAFVGANPYARAFNRGVKLIGATAHYVTNDLDEGPIIEQDVQRVNHRHTAQDLKIAGRHVERQVLAQAVAWHVEDKVIVHGNKTIVF
ncbi:formyltetrahydrofolate deformylase [Cytobacillus pseudoceanisediminis]|uniref:formyltetrahydrofolate deformylase n=1 Tax=Cytobacillus pseudoceanisediminis TaxID=3051614 RepID=UPI003C2F2F47